MSGFGTWLESDWYETRNELPCKCCAVFPRHASDHLSSVSINGIYTDCTKCKPNGERSRRIKEIANRIKATLFRHLHAKPRIVCNDVTVRYLKRFGGQTFAVQTEIDECDVFLKNDAGEVLAVVSLFDRFPKPLPPPATFADMPY